MNLYKLETEVDIVKTFATLIFAYFIFLKITNKNSEPNLVRYFFTVKYSNY